MSVSKLKKSITEREIHMSNFRVWHVSNPPREAFYARVCSAEEGKAVLDAIAIFDLEVGDGEEKPIANIGKRNKLLIDIPKKFPDHKVLVSKYLSKYEKHLAAQNNGVTICYCNAQGLEQEIDGEWEEWYDEYDNDIHTAFEDDD